MAKKKALAGAGKTVAKLKAKQADKRQGQINPQPSLQAMVWYKEEHYQPLLEMFTDKELLPKSFADWEVRAKAAKKEVEAAGDQVIKVFLEPETFAEWCKKNNCPPDAEARSQLAIEVAQSHSFSL